MSYTPLTVLPNNSQSSTSNINITNNTMFDL